MSKYIICGTGHRPDKLGGYSPKAFEKLVDIATYGLNTLKPDRIITGMALGWDQALAVACIRNNVKFIAAVPFIGQESMWPDSSQKLYRRILGKAMKVEVISEGGFSVAKMNKRNQWMVDNSHSVMAMWNGRRHGGTWQAIQYARCKGKEIINLFPTFQASIYE